MANVVLGIDLGTSAVKCVLVRDQDVIGVGHAGLTINSPSQGWSEQNPADWIAAVARACAQAIDVANIAPKEIGGIGLSGQMHGAVVLGNDHKVLRPAILWNDNRSTKQCADLSQRFPKIGDVGGVPPLPGFTAPKLMWLKENEPGIYAQISTVLLPKDYVGLWLTGTVFSDMSDAAGTLWLDQKARCWSAPLAAASDVELDWLPPLLAGFERAGSLRNASAQALGLSTDIPVFAGAGDAAAGALSIGAATAGRCFISLGTSGQLLVVDDSYQPNPDKFVHAFCHTLPDLWYRMAAMLNGARPLSWFAKVLNISVPDLLAEAKRADLNRVPLFLPYLTGERSPHGDPQIRGGFFGLEDATGRPEMCRAVVEAIAFMMRDAADSFGETFVPQGPVPVIGGGSRSDLVLQTLSSVLGHRVARTEAGTEGPAYGAALLAATGLGLQNTQALSFAPPLKDIQEPKIEDRLENRLGEFRRLYASLRRSETL